MSIQQGLEYPYLAIFASGFLKVFPEASPAIRRTLLRWAVPPEKAWRPQWLISTADPNSTPATETRRRNLRT